MISNGDYIECFSDLESAYTLSERSKESIEKYVCSLYGKSKLKTVDETRSAIFWENNKIIELCLLPPCFRNFKFHLERSNYVAYIFKHADQLIMDLQSSLLHGWHDGKFQWTDEYFPTDITDALLNAEKSSENDELDDLSGYVDENDDADVCLEDFN